MNGAINIRAENYTASPILKLWDKVSTFEETPSMQSLKYAPHFTFAIYQDVNPEKLQRAAEKASKNLTKIPITFSKISTFDAEKLVLWLKADDETQLFSIHQTIHETISPQECHEYYRPNIWQPHCTIGMKFSSNMREQVIDFSKQPFKPFTVNFDVVDWLTFSPVKILGEINLR